MNTDFINLTNENLTDEHLCCIIRSKKSHPGIDAKRQWLSERLSEGHIFRKLNAKATVFIEYAPLETAWVPIIGNNYYYLYCLWVLGAPKEKDMENRSWSIVWLMRKRKANPVFVCSGQKNKRAGFPTRHLPKSSALRLSILPIMDMNC